MSATLANQRWEKFAQLVASGENGAAAYRTCYGARGASAQTNASRLLRNDNVRLRVAELRTVAAAAAAERDAAAVRQSAQQLTTTLLTVQRRREIAREIAENTAHRASDRLAAVLADAKLAGELVEKAEIEDRRAVSPERRAELLRLAVSRRRETDAIHSQRRS